MVRKLCLLDMMNETENIDWFSSISQLLIYGGVAQWVARMTRNVEVVGSSPIKGPRCFIEQENLPLLLSTGWL